MEVARLILLTLVIVGTIYYVISSLSLIRHIRHRRPHTARVRYSISILKPVCGLDNCLESNLRSYLDQCREDGEILLGTLEPDDPALVLLRKLENEYPCARLFCGAEIDGPNNKIRVLDNLMRQASGDLIIISDSDTCASPGFIDRLVAPFTDPAVSLMTCLYKGVGGSTFSDALQSMHMSAVFSPGVALRSTISSMDFGLGACIAIRRDALNDIGGFEALAYYLADDFQLGQKVHKSGGKVLMSGEVIDVVLGAECLWQVLERELRWSATIRISSPWGHLGLVFTFGFAYALVYLLTSPASLNSWLLFTSVTAIRLVTALAGAAAMGDREIFSRFYLLPVRDILTFVIWCCSYCVRSVRWRGTRLRLQANGVISRF